MTVWGPGAPKYGPGGRPIRRRKPSAVKKSCDALWSKLVKARAGERCERCGAVPEDPRGFHAHHVDGRNNHRLRYDVRNGVALCAACHRWGHDHPLLYAKWFSEHRPEDAEWVMMDPKQREILKRSLSDYLELEQSLRSMLNNARRR